MAIHAANLFLSTFFVVVASAGSAMYVDMYIFTPRAPRNASFDPCRYLICSLLFFLVACFFSNPCRCQDFVNPVGEAMFFLLLQTVVGIRRPKLNRPHVGQADDAFLCLLPSAGGYWSTMVVHSFFAYAPGLVLSRSRLATPVL